MAKVDKATFDKYVDFACDILRTERRKWGETVPDGMLQLYRQTTEKKRQAFLRNLIALSKNYRFAWDALSRIAQDQLRKKRPLRPQLANWVSAVLAGTRPQPKTKGPDLNANVLRDRAIVIAVLVLLRNGLNPIRNLTQKGIDHPKGKGIDHPKGKGIDHPKGKGIDHPNCDHVGGSACDAVGKALEEVCGEGQGYKNIERIWYEGVSAGTTLEWPVPFLFKVPTIKITVPSSTANCPQNTGTQIG